MKKESGVLKKSVVGFELGVLVVSFFAFSYFIYSMDVVGAQDIPDYEAKGLSSSNINTPPVESLDITAPSTSRVGAGAVGKEKASSWLSDFFKAPAAGGWDAILTGAQWAAIAFFAGQLIGGLLGWSDKNTDALSYALGTGVGLYKGLSAWSETQGWTTFNPLVSIGVGAIIFLYMYRDVETEVVTFDCLAWQAPTGGNDCEACNDDVLPCSEYRCKALGQSCEIVEGKSGELCVYVNPRDVNPPIVRPWIEALSLGHEYRNVRASPPGPGFEIVNVEAADGCLKAFTALEFGLRVDEPAQCKIDFEHKESFEEMSVYVGGSNLYAYNHTERFSLPSTEAFANSSLVLENGKDMTLFIRCMDKNGNENEAEYAVEFCVDPSPDTTAPKIEATSVSNGGCVAENMDSAAVEFYTNEPADCRWSVDDQDFDNMINGMSCSGALYQANAVQLFTCVANLTGISRTETNYFVRCKDRPGDAEADRNEMKQSFEFSLIGSTGLKMKNLQPNNTVFGAVSPMPIELRAETLFGCNNGRAVCRYSTTGEAGSYIRFFDTDTVDGVHTQSLSLTAGRQEYFVQCVDEGGNLVEDNIVFDLEIDVNAPVVARIYEEDGMLKIVTVRDSECAYTLNDCDFSFSEGTEMPYANSSVHVAEWDNQKTYYIKCRDEFRNEDADCSVIVRPTRSFL
jgi:hypothetical protein